MAKKRGWKFGNFTSRKRLRVLPSILGLGVMIGLLVLGVKYIDNVNLAKRLRVMAAEDSCKCYPEDESYCQGVMFHPYCGNSSPQTQYTCMGTKVCPPTDTTPRPTSNPNWPLCIPLTPRLNDGCQVGATECQKNTAGQNTGYVCKCVDQSHYSDSLKQMCFQSVWSCGGIDNTKCPGVGGGVDVVRDTCVDENNGNKVKVMNNTGRRCFYMTDKYDNRIKLSAARFSCPNSCSALGCNSNGDYFNAVDQVCFEEAICGAQQIDFQFSAGAKGCTVSVCDDTNCSTPPTKPAAKAVCNIKTAWKDEPDNGPGIYNLKTQIPSGSKVKGGEIMVFQIKFSNKKSTPVTDSRLVDTLPTNLTFIDASPGCQYVNSTRKVTCNIGFLAANVTSDVKIRVKVNNTSTSFTNSSYFTYKGLTTNTYCKLSLTAEAQPSAYCTDKKAFESVVRNNDYSSFILGKEYPAGSVVEKGATLVYRIGYKNDGPVDINDFKLIDVIPENLDIMQTSTGCKEGSANTIECSLGTLKAGVTGYVYVRARVKEVEGRFNNFAYVQYPGQLMSATCQIDLRMAPTPVTPTKSPTPTTTLITNTPVPPSSPTPTRTPTPPPPSSPTPTPTVKLCQIGGKVFNDKNGNRKWDGGTIDSMEGVENWTVYLYEGSQVTANPLRYQSTRNGFFNNWPNSFRFDGLVCGRTYTIVGQGKVNWVSSGDYQDNVTAWLGPDGLSRGRVTLSLPVNLYDAGLHIGYRYQIAQPNSAY